MSSVRTFTAGALVGVGASGLIWLGVNFDRVDEGDARRETGTEAVVSDVPLEPHVRAAQQPWTVSARPAGAASAHAAYTGEAWHGVFSGSSGPKASIRFDPITPAVTIHWAYTEGDPNPLLRSSSGYFHVSKNQIERTACFPSAVTTDGEDVVYVAGRLVRPPHRHVLLRLVVTRAEHVVTASGEHVLSLQSLAERDILDAPPELAGVEISGLHALDHIPGHEGRVLVHTQAGRELYEVDFNTGAATLRASAFAPVGTLAPIPPLDTNWPDQQRPYEHSVLGLVTITGKHMGDIDLLGSSDSNLLCGVVLYDLAPYDGVLDGWFELTPANWTLYDLRE